METRLQMVEITQFNQAQKREDIQNKLVHLTHRNKLLLEERLLEIHWQRLSAPNLMLKIITGRE